jgi:Mor family transcriptional regulator
VTVETRFSDIERGVLDLVGPDLFYELCQRYGGRSLYLKKAHWNEIRNEYIRQRYNTIIETAPRVRYCDVVRKLGREYGLSKSQIRRVLSEKKVAFLE